MALHMEDGDGDGPIAYSSKLRRPIDPVDVSAMDIDEEGKAIEAGLRVDFRTTVQDVLTRLTASMNEENCARRLVQVESFAAIAREGFRTLGQYDFPEHRRRFQRRKTGMMPSFGEQSDAETVGAVAMTSGMDAMQAGMRAKQIADLSQALKSLAGIEGVEEKREQIVAELSLLLANVPARLGSPKPMPKPSEPKPSERSYVFTLNGIEHEWPHSTIFGAEIRAFLGDNKSPLFLETVIEGKLDIPVADDTDVWLGTELPVALYTVDVPLVGGDPAPFQ